MKRLLLLLFVGTLWLGWAAASPQSLAMTTFGYTWLALFYLCLILIAVSYPDGHLARAVSCRPLRSLGILA